MIGISICKICKKEFKWRRVNRIKNLPVFCSKYCQYILKNMNLEQKKNKYKDFFFRDVIKNDGCWGWKGKLSPDGYPRMTCRKEYGTQRANRASWIIHKGEIPKGMIICHNCPEGDNIKCCNPEHLFLGTPSDNSEDMVKKERSARGSQNGQSKLDEEKVREIKILISKGLFHSEIAKLFNVNRDTISKINRKISWKHVK